MKNIAICLFGLLMLGCKENSPSIDFGIPSIDTSYVLTSVPAAEPHEVLVEEYTGQSCGNCPSAHTNLEGLAAANPGRLNVIGLYIYGPPQGNPPPGSKHDFRDGEATEINKVIYNGKNNLPSGGVDRIPLAGDISLYAASWASAISSQLGVTDSLNLFLESNFDSASNTATILTRVTYLKPTTTTQKLSIAIVEDGMVDHQDFFGSVEPDYEFTNVFRGMVTAVPAGDDIGSITAKEVGRVFQKVYSYKLKALTPAIKPRNCRVIAFVTNSGVAGDYRVIQSKQCKLIKP